MDVHDKVHHAIQAVLAATVIGGGVAIFNTPKLPVLIAPSVVGALKTIPETERHHVTIFCAPGCSDLARQMADDFDAAGWSETIESAIQADHGVIVSAPKDTGQKIGDALSAALGYQVRVEDGDWTIAIGPPPRDRRK